MLLMNKKSGIFLLLCLSGALLTFNSCEKNLKIKLYVSRDNGAEMKTSPALEAPLLTVVPFNESVVLMDYSTNSDLIGDIASRWAKVQYQGRKGWIFAAYLSDQRVNPFRNNILRYIDSISNALSINSDNTTNLLAEMGTRFGKPLKASSNKVANKYDTNNQDTEYSISYPGLDFEVYEVSADKRQLIQAIVLKSSAYPLLYNLKPGISSLTVTNTLGSPEEESDVALIYRLEGATLAFVLTNNVVREIHLVNYID